MAETPRSADVVLAGGGVIGCSLAHHLAARGLRVVLCERETLGSQSTARCAGGVRQQFSSELNVRMQRFSVERLKHFEEEIGHPMEFRQTGYLFLLSTDEEVRTFRAQLDMWHRVGLREARWVTPEEAQELSPAITTDGLLGGTYCPTDGIASSNDVTAGYASAARKEGAQLLEGVAVTGIEVESGRVRAVDTSAGTIATSLVVDCAGAWSGEIGTMAGIELPVEPYPRHVFVTEPTSLVSRSAPLTIDFATSFYFHPEGDGVLFGMGERDERPSFRTDVDWSFLEKMEPVVSHRFPALLELGIQTAWVGLYETTPDHQPFLGPVDEVDGFWCACGFSGHGFQMAPAVGALLGELLVDGRTWLDLSPFSPDRRRAGAWQPEANVV
ncbi:MAG TPA: FAD-binding oxidoreductase [Candidatus Binatia bacterium]|nr:FAD-binding oxidoreductase [Candidatus Binatia bacterium]